MITHIEKYGSSWCQPCKLLDRTLKQLTGFDVVKYDVDEWEDLANEKGIRNVPVLIFYDGDNEVDRLVGAVPLAKINEIIEKWKNQ
jgi:thioredoxin-like negative regulator of GroEL